MPCRLACPGEYGDHSWPSGESSPLAGTHSCSCRIKGRTQHVWKLTSARAPAPPTQAKEQPAGGDTAQHLRRQRVSSPDPSEDKRRKRIYLSNKEIVGMAGEKVCLRQGVQWGACTVSRSFSSKQSPPLETSTHSWSARLPAPRGPSISPKRTGANLSLSLFFSTSSKTLESKPNIMSR